MTTTQMRHPMCVRNAAAAHALFNHRPYERGSERARVLFHDDDDDDDDERRVDIETDTAFVQKTLEGDASKDLLRGGKNLVSRKKLSLQAVFSGKI